MTDNYGVGVSRVLDTGDKSWELVVWQENKPPLDSELNLMQQIQDEKFFQVLSSTPSGILDPIDITGKSSGFTTGEIAFNSALFGVNTFLVPPFRANIDGRIIDVRFGDVNGGGVAVDGVSTLVKLDPPPATGARQDFVFLEAWRQMVATKPSSLGKPSPDKIYPYGNTQWASTYQDDDLQDPEQSVTTTYRIQVQYRIRVVSDVDFDQYPNGIDSTAVLAQGGMTAPAVGYSFELSADKIGLYVAGDGTSAAQLALGSVDGYVFGLPLLRIHRRNSQLFTNVNLNGSAESVLTGNKSERPDGLYKDEINYVDVEDLRHHVSMVGHNLTSTLFESKSAWFKGDIATIHPSQQTMSSQGSRVLQIDGVAETDIPGVQDIGRPNGQRRYYSDAPIEQRTYSPKSISDKSYGVNGGNWQTGDKFTVEVAPFSPGGVLVLALPTPEVKALVGTAYIDVVGTWIGLGTTTAEFTMGVNGSVSNQTLAVNYTVSYPKGNGLTYVPEEVLQAYDPISAQEIFFTSYEDSYRERESTGFLTRIINGYADKWYDRNLLYAPDILAASVAFVHYHFDGGGVNYYTVPAQVAGRNITNVRRVISLDISPTPTVLDFNEVLNPDGTITVNLGTIIPTGKTIRVEVGMMGQGMVFLRPTKALIEQGEVLQVSATLVGATNYSFDCSNIMLAAQGAEQATVGETGRVFVNGVGINVVWTFSSSSSIATITFASPTSGTMIAYIVRAKTLGALEQYRVSYFRKPYFGQFLADNRAVGGFKAHYVEDPLEGRLTLKALHDDRTTYHLTAGTQDYRAGASNAPSLFSGFLEQVPFRHPSSLAVYDFSSELTGPLGCYKGSDFISQPMRESSEVGLPMVSGTMAAGFPDGGSLTFEGFGSLSSTGHFSGLMRLMGSNNHVNMSVQLCQVLVTRSEFKLIPGELVLLVVTQTEEGTDSPEINWKEASTQVLWDIIPVKGRCLSPLI